MVVTLSLSKRGGKMSVSELKKCSDTLCIISQDKNLSQIGRNVNHKIKLVFALEKWGVTDIKCP